MRAQALWRENRGDGFPRAAQFTLGTDECSGPLGSIRKTAMTGLGIIENLLSDALFILLILILGWLWVHFTRRTQLHAFFGVSGSRRIVIYLSNIRVLTFGAVGLSGQKMSYQGSTVAHGEMLAANRIRDLFSFIIPSASEGPTFLSRLLFSDVLVQVLLSPLDAHDVDAQAPLISLGSPAYSAASLFIETNTPGGARFRFGVLRSKEVDASPPFAIHPVAGSTDTEVHILPYRGGTVSMPSASPSLPADPKHEEEKPSAILVRGVPDITGTNYAFVQRTFDASNGRPLFYVAGLSEAATASAAQFLASHWQYLRRRHGASASFLTMLTFEPPDFRKWSVVFEREISNAA